LKEKRREKQRKKRKEKRREVEERREKDHRLEPLPFRHRASQPSQATTSATASHCKRQ